MSEFFLKIVNMSISASWLVLAVLLLRLVLKKAPKWVSVLLWGFVAVRLICPFSIESVLSLIPSAETINPEIMTDWTPEVSTGIGSLDTVVNPIITETFAPKPYASANPLQILIPVAAVAWIVGIAAMLIYTAVSYILLRRKVATAVLLRNNINQSENVDSPFVLGIIKPKIYLPFQMDDQNLEHIIAHEESHIRRKDHWWKPFGFLLLAIHWFNPLMWLGYILLCRDIELACDEKVIKEMDNESKADYTQALVACSVNRRSIAACPLAFGEVGVKERVKSVMNYKKPAFWIIVAAVVTCIVVAVCFLTNPSASPEFTMHGNNVQDLEVDTIIDQIQKVEKLGDGNAYINSNNFHLTVDSDFNWVDSQTVRYFFYEGKETHSAQLRIHPEENKYFLTDSAEWGEQNKVFLLRHYLDAIKYLPQDAIRHMAPADRYIVRQIEEGTPNNYSRVITYTPNGTAETDDWLIHLQLEPLHAAEEGYTGTGDEVIQLFYANADDYISDVNKLLSLVNDIANNPDCAASSNPFTYIEARQGKYNEILTHGSDAVDFFVEQLRTGENGLQGYIMAVACADITGIGDKDTGANWATAQEWLALYEMSGNNTAIGGVDGPSVVYSEVKLTDSVSDSQESSYKVNAFLSATDLSSPGQILADKIAKEWNTFDGMTQQQHLTSSHLWGLVYVNTDTWEECEQAIGFSIDNPLEAIDWISKTGYFGMESAEPSTPVTHVQATAYATQSTDRKLSEISVTAGYNTGSVRITLTTTVSANTGTMTTGSTTHGYATYEKSTATTGSGIPVLVVTTNETNNLGYYNGDYFDPTAYWVKDNVFYTLRVFGDETNKSAIQETLNHILSEI